MEGIPGRKHPPRRAETQPAGRGSKVAPAMAGTDQVWLLYVHPRQIGCFLKHACTKTCMYVCLHLYGVYSMRYMYMKMYMSMCMYCIYIYVYIYIYAYM